jgi:hypothetical protein
MNQIFLKKLLENGWAEISDDREYRKGAWTILRDTGSWWMIMTKEGNRVFDFPEPTDSTALWTVNLIDHLCLLEGRG